MNDDRRPDPNSDAERRRIAQLLHAAGPRPEPSEHCARRIRAAVHASWRESLARRRRHRLGLAAAAAAAALVAFVIPWLLLGRNVPTDGSRVAVARSVLGGISVETGEGVTATEPLARGQVLEQGSVLWTGSGAAELELDTGSRIRIDSDTELCIESSTRLRLASGRVFVDSDTDVNGVIVETPLGIARDIGTRFEVAVGRGRLSVRVRNGFVRVSAETSEVSLARGQSARVEAGRDIVIGVEPPAGASWDWLRRFPSAPPVDPSVAELLAWYAAEEGLVVRYSSDALALEATEVSVLGDLSDLERERLLEIALSATTFRARVEGEFLIVARLERR